MRPSDKRRFLRRIYARSFKITAVCLVLSMIIGRLYSDSRYTVYAMCAAGPLVLCAEWFRYLRKTDSRPFRKSGRKIPDFLRRPEERTRWRPAFRRDSRDFHDDLDEASDLSPDGFSERQLALGQLLSAAGACLLLFLISFLVRQ